MRNKLIRRLGALWISFDDLAYVIKAMGTFTMDVYENAYVMEKYICGVFSLEINTEIINGVQSMYITIAGDVRAAITPENSYKGKDPHGIPVKKPVASILASFKKDHELYIKRWNAVEKLRILQREIFKIAGQT